MEYYAFILLLGILTADVSGQYQKIRDLEKTFWNWRMEDSPNYATNIGLYAYNDRLKSYNTSTIEKRKMDVDNMYSLLMNISTDGFRVKEKVDYEILADTLSTFLDGHKWALYSLVNPTNFLEGIHLFYPVSKARTNTHGDFENYIVRLNGIPKLIQEVKESMDMAIELNRTLHRHSVEHVPAQISLLLVNETEKSYFYLPFNQTLDDAVSIPTSVKNDIRMRGHDAVTTTLNAYRDLMEYMQNVYIPNTRPGIGLSTLQNGSDYYRACLKWHLSYDLSPEDVHNIGLQEVDTIHKNMLEVLKKQQFSGTVKDFFASLKNDSRFVWDDADRIIKEYEDIIENRINPKLPSYFKDIPDLPLVVKKLHFDGPIAAYEKATEESPGVFYVNLFRPRENPVYDFMVLALHEANPGHHLQTIFALKADLPSYRRSAEISFYQVPYFFPFYTAYVEGWGLYSEYLGEEMGLYKDDFELMGRYSAEMLRACRLVVDTGLHLYDWSQERAIEYMLNYTAFSREAITIEVNRYISLPGQACAYKIGERRIKELRKEAEMELGTQFDIREFHSVILKNGPMPLSVLDEVVQDWINSQRAIPSTSTATAVFCQREATAAMVVSSYAIYLLIFRCTYLMR